MPDMLVRLYDLPDPLPYYRRVEEQGVVVRRAEPWEREAFRSFIESTFHARWADEAEAAYSRQPVTAFVATHERELIGFAAYECTRRNYFGPTGVREEWRGNGIGAALLFRCLESMYALGYAYAVIGGVHEAGLFYEKLCGAIEIPGSEPGIYGISRT